jgi:uroporphyrinogen-III synthase
LGIKTNFVGVDKPKSIAQSLINKYADTSICFVRADQSTQSIQKFWKNEYSEVIAYSVNPRSIKIQEKIHTIIATSPMNLIAALKCCNVKNIKHIVCIGPTTYNAAASISDVDIIMADKANEESMLEAYIRTSKR